MLVIAFFQLFFSYSGKVNYGCFSPAPNRRYTTITFCNENNFLQSFLKNVTGFL